MHSLQCAYCLKENKVDVGHVSFICSSFKEGKTVLSPTWVILDTKVDVILQRKDASGTDSLLTWFFKRGLMVENLVFPRFPEKHFYDTLGN